MRYNMRCFEYNFDGLIHVIYARDRKTADRLIAPYHTVGYMFKPTLRTRLGLAKHMTVGIPPLEVEMSQEHEINRRVEYARKGGN